MKSLFKWLPFSLLLNRSHAPLFQGVALSYQVQSRSIQPDLQYNLGTVLHFEGDGNLCFPTSR